MKEIKSIIETYDTYKAQGLKMALATVVNVEQSSYRRSGARMLITEDGNWIGGISGGCLEGDTLKKAKYAIIKQKSTKVTYDTRDGDPDQIGVGLGCNGLIDVLISPITDNNNPVEVLRAIVTRREPSLLVTDLQDGSTVDYTHMDSSDKTLNTLITRVKTKGRSHMTNENGGLFIEFIAPAISVYIFGSSYDVIPLATLSKELGWNTIVIANPLKVSKGIQKIATHIIPATNATIPMDDYSVALLMSHDYKTDEQNLIRLQGQNIPYIGLLGPQKRRMKLMAALDEQNIKINSQNLYGPMGLDTGATTPEEISVSILAEIRSVLSKRDGGQLRYRLGSIH